MRVPCKSFLCNNIDTKSRSLCAANHDIYYYKLEGLLHDTITCHPLPFILIGWEHTIMLPSYILQIRCNYMRTNTIIMYSLMTNNISGTLRCTDHIFGLDVNLEKDLMRGSCISPPIGSTLQVWLSNTNTPLCIFCSIKVSLVDNEQTPLLYSI